MSLYVFLVTLYGQARDGATYRPARMNIPITAIFCRLGMFSRQTIGIGSTSTAAFRSVLMVARLTKEVSRGMQVPDIRSHM